MANTKKTPIPAGFKTIDEWIMEVCTYRNVTTNRALGLLHGQKSYPRVEINGVMYFDYGPLIESYKAEHEGLVPFIQYCDSHQISRHILKQMERDGLGKFVKTSPRKWFVKPEEWDGHVAEYKKKYMSEELIPAHLAAEAIGCPVALLRKQFPAKKGYTKAFVGEHAAALAKFKANNVSAREISDAAKCTRQYVFQLVGDGRLPKREHPLTTSTYVARRDVIRVMNVPV